MLVATVLHEMLKNSIHKTRIKSLIQIITGIIDAKTLKLTTLGRALSGKCSEKSGIRQIDRVLANEFYQNNAIKIYKQIMHYLIKENSQPIILIDWTKVPNSHFTAKNGEQYSLRATLATEGRGIILYEEVHSKKLENNPLIHKKFLNNLGSILPSNCKPCIVTDAGFKSSWFKTIIDLKWDYVGRIRGVVQYYNKTTTSFKSIKDFFTHANHTPQYLGQYDITKTNPIAQHVYVYKHILQGRKKFNRKGMISKKSQKYSSGYKEPWVIVSSIKKCMTSKSPIEIYKTRMTIEESIRDTKSEKYGLSFNENETINTERYKVWFMLAALASFVAWLVGYAAEKQKLHYSFQANTYRNKRVLSFFFLGCQIIRKKLKIPIIFLNIKMDIFNMSVLVT